MILIPVLAQCLSWSDDRRVLWYTRQSSAAFGLCWSRHSGSFLKKRLIPSLFSFLTSSWLLHFHRKTLPASAWLGVLQLLRQAAHKVRAFALTVPFACNTVLPDVRVPSSSHAGFCPHGSISEGCLWLPFQNNSLTAPHVSLSPGPGWLLPRAFITV